MRVGDEHLFGRWRHKISRWRHKIRGYSLLILGRAYIRVGAAAMKAGKRLSSSGSGKPDAERLFGLVVGLILGLCELCVALIIYGVLDLVIPPGHPVRRATLVLVAVGGLVSLNMALQAGSQIRARMTRLVAEHESASSAKVGSTGPLRRKSPNRGGPDSPDSLPADGDGQAAVGDNSGC